jgi:hypothetical protein
MTYHKSDRVKQKEIDNLKGVIELVANGSNIEDACLKVGISSRTFRNLKQRYNVPNNFSDTLLENGFDGESWSNGWLKVDGASIHIKNNKESTNVQDTLEELKEYLKDHRPIQVEVPEPMGDHLLVIDPADIHIGKLCTNKEGVITYNCDIAVKRCLLGVMDLLKKSSGFNIDQVILVIGNDCLHIDNKMSQTSKGTNVDSDTLWPFMFSSAKKMYIEIIEFIRSIYPIHVIHNRSNHDEILGHCLADSLQSWFKECKGVTFDVSNKDRKYYKYGDNLIGLMHGDKSKADDSPMLMAQEQKELWGNTTYRYWYLHHIHHMKKLKWVDGKDYIGVSLEYLRSPSPSDQWHEDSGYISPKGMSAFLHHKNNGQVARLNVYFE